MGQYIGIEEAARRASVCERTIRRRIADGTLKARRFGPRLIRIEAAELERALAVNA